MASFDETVIAQVAEVLTQQTGLTVHFDPPAVDATSGHFSPVSAVPLHEVLSEALSKVYDRGLFKHQRLALEHVLAGRNTVVATRTSSGKSLIYCAPSVRRTFAQSRRYGSIHLSSEGESRATSLRS